MRAWLRALIYALVLVVLAVVLLWWNLRPVAPLAVPKRGARLGDVTVIQPGVARSPHRSLTVEGETIASLGAAGGAPDAFAGHYVLPGLVDAHVHFPPAALVGHAELFSFLFLYHGVTSVRDAGDPDGTSTGTVRDASRSGEFPAPRVFACGPFLDGYPPGQPNSRVLREPADAEPVVAELAEAGFDCLKIYNQLEPDVLEAVRVAARKHGLPTIGHVPWRVPYEDARLDDVQHLTHLPGSPDGLVGYPEVMERWLQFDDVRLEHVIEATLAHGIANTPTLVTSERRSRMDDLERLREEPDAQLLPRFWRDVIWSPVEGLSYLRGHSEADSALLRAALPQMSGAVRALHEAGAVLRAGTDTPSAFAVPGAALHRELRLLRDAGISPEEVLAIATRPAVPAGPAGLGEIRPGAPADLVIFREDPTRDLSALGTLSGVIADGRLYTREALDEQLALYRDQFENPIYDAVMTGLVRRLLSAASD